MVLLPILTSVVSTADRPNAPFVACGAEEEGEENASCCTYDAVCGLNGKNYDEREYYAGSCSERDKNKGGG